MIMGVNLPLTLTRGERSTGEIIASEESLDRLGQ
jgi:hypothetical protein